MAKGYGSRGRSVSPGQRDYSRLDKGELEMLDKWLEEDSLMLIECWARDGYTMNDIANKIGITEQQFLVWRHEYPEIQEAVRTGKEMIDYKVENALLKSALGYQTKEVKVTTTMRYGKVVETIREVTEKEQAPNVSAIQTWLYNRERDKWKNMNAKQNILDDIDNDTSIEITVTRAGKDEDNDTKVNKSVSLRKRTEEEQAEAEAEQKKKQKEKERLAADTVIDDSDMDEGDSSPLDEWPEDWEDEE